MTRHEIMTRAYGRAMAAWRARKIEQKTYREIAEDFGVGIERARQLATKGRAIVIRMTKAELRAGDAVDGAMTAVSTYIVAVLQDHGEMYGAELRRRVSRRMNREISAGEFYVVCDRLEIAGLVVSRDGEETNDRGRRKRMYCMAAGSR